MGEIKIKMLKERVNILRAREEIVEKNIKTFQELGFIEKPTERSEIKTEGEIANKMEVIVIDSNPQASDTKNEDDEVNEDTTKT